MYPPSRALQDLLEGIAVTGMRVGAAAKQQGSRLRWSTQDKGPKVTQCFALASVRLSSEDSETSNLSFRFYSAKALRTQKTIGKGM